MRIVSPSILSADFADLKNQVKMVTDNGAEYVHIDVMDGHFVPNISIGPCVIESLRPYSKAVFDVHLMIENPEKYVESFAKSGADIITVHLEAVKDMDKMIEQLRSLGVKIGVSINPETDVEKLIPFADRIDMALVMTVHPGFGGQSLIEECLDKVKVLRQKFPELDIEVDGGIKPSNVKLALDAGANVIVAGSAVFCAEDPKAVIQQILQA
ncbi:MAG: ribulose-phosphate 3-epimerase [Clostridia bacterium]|nr:ribulose-phosphate 3-epimerase [Clostridia bacterium]